MYSKVFFAELLKEGTVREKVNQDLLYSFRLSVDLTLKIKDY